MEIIKKNIYLIILIGLCFFAVSALLNPGFFPIHDDEQVGRLFELNYSLSSLHFPPRISQNLGFGYGYPFFNFYPSFVYYVAEIFLLLGFSFIWSIKIMVGLGFVLSAVTMYLFSKQYVGKLGGLVAGVLYLYAPYHSVDAYVRGAFPEFWTFVFIPAVFWAMYRISKNAILGNALFLGLMGAFLMLTHNLILIMSIPFFGVYFIYLWCFAKDKKELTISMLIGGLVAILLSAYFWMPAILENKFTMVSLLTTQLADYNLHFVSLPQFVNSAWGYGGSILGPMDGFSLEVGKIQLILAALALMIAGFLFIKSRFKFSISILIGIMLVFSIFMQSYYSKLIWDNIPALAYIQFPWRFMIFSVFASAFLGGYLFSINFNEKVKGVLAVFVILGTILLYGNYFKPSDFLTNATDEDYISQDVLRWKTSAMAFEYVPAGIATKNSALNTTIVDIDRSQIARETATPLTENMQIDVLSDKPQYKKLKVVSEDASKLRINTFSFPGWKVFINNKEIDYNDKNKFKLLDISVPSGESVVEAKFMNTSVRSIANILSIIGIVIALLIIPFYSKKIKL